MTVVQIDLSGAKELREHLRERHDFSRKNTDNPLGQLRNLHEAAHFWLGKPGHPEEDHTHDRF